MSAYLLQLLDCVASIERPTLVEERVSDTLPQKGDFFTLEDGRVFKVAWTKERGYPLDEEAPRLMWVSVYCVPGNQDGVKAEKAIKEARIKVDGDKVRIALDPHPYFGDTYIELKVMANGVEVFTQFHTQTAIVHSGSNVFLVLPVTLETQQLNQTLAPLAVPSDAEMSAFLANVQDPPTQENKDAYFSCPECGQGMDHYRNVGRDHYGVCLNCQAFFLIGSNLFSGYREENESTWNENKLYLVRFKRVGYGPEHDTIHWFNDDGSIVF